MRINEGEGAPSFEESAFLVLALAGKGGSRIVSIGFVIEPYRMVAYARSSE